MSVSSQIRPYDGLAEKPPPQNLDAERGLIGAMLYDNNLINDVIPIVDADDFFRIAHQVVFKTICDIYNAGNSVDCVILADELTHAGKFHQIGGDDLLEELTGGEIHRLDALHYAAIVRQKSITRKLIEVSTDVIRDGYSNLYTSEELLERAEKGVFGVAERRVTANTVGMPEVVGGVMERIRKAKEEGEVFGMSTGLLDLDERIGGFRPGQLIVLAARPGNGKTAIAMTMAMNRAEKQISTLFISLEMESEELGFRMISAKASIDSRKLLDNEPFVGDEAQRVAIAGVEIEKSRLYIDATPGQSLLRVAANARRRKQTDNLEFLVIDYLGLINETATRNQNTVDVMTKISNGLKNLAKELRIPILALHQLNRESEKDQRRPRKSDLRGCLTRDTTIYCSKTGSLRTVGEYVDSNEGPFVYGINESGFGRDWKIVKSAGEPFWSTGVQPVFKMRTKSGRVIRCTANHPFRTLAGWTPLESLRIGQRVAVPRILSSPLDLIKGVGMHKDRAKLLGYLISDGHYGKHRTVNHTKGEVLQVDDVERIACEQFGIIAKEHNCNHRGRSIDLTGPGTGPGSNPLINWLKELGILGQLCQDKRIPESMFIQPNDVISAFIGSLWAGDGCVVRRKTGGWQLKFVSTSMALLNQLQMLLLRLGIVSVLGKPERNSLSKSDIATLHVSDSRQVVRFADQIDIPGIKGRKLRIAAGECRDMHENSHVDRLPIELNESIREAKEEQGHSWSTLRYRVQGKEISRESLACVASVLCNDRLADLSDSDILWDLIESIEPDGEEEVFDTRVPGVHNFVAGGMCVHNSGSIEQDADVILLLHTEMSEEDVEGPVEMIIAKNRAGRTGTVNFWFNKPFNRFEQMALQGQVRAAETYIPPPRDDNEPF